ncbi:AAA family ATPase [Moraxella sp. ZY200743]|uniref:AAA family ATPase n=1 Tax=Moraxella sp. ZY200743 TaxID=2911970 RepID=UPI003D7EFDA6
MNTTLKQVAQHIPQLWKAGIVPFLHSSPAQGKSSLAKQLAKEFGLKVIDLRLTELDPTDLSGLPYFNNNKAEFMPFNTFPLQDTPIPEGYEGWLLVLDEFNSANQSVMAAAYKLILDRQVGQHKLNDKVVMIACGNLETDNAIVNPMSSALISRFAHFNIEINVDDWLEWAAKADIDYRITSYINFKKTALYTFNPDVTEPYASPRTWEMLSKVIKGIDEPSLLLAASLIGDGVANEFIAYTKLYQQIPTIKTILDNPSDTTIPSEIATKWAVMSMVTHSMNMDNYEKCEIYLRRFPMELQYCAMREIKHRQPILLTKLTSWITTLAKEVF